MRLKFSSIRMNRLIILQKSPDDESGEKHQNQRKYFERMRHRPYHHKSAVIKQTDYVDITGL